MQFYKYQGTGNDFIIIDNLQGDALQLKEEQVKHFCHRRFGIGADGLLIMRHKEGYDFEMIYYNADGRPGTMCGNGGRCMIQFAQDRGIHKYSYHFLAPDGKHEAEIDLHGNIRLKMQDVDSVEDLHGNCVLNTGSPHYVKFVNDVSDMDVVETGREIRYSNAYKKEGINVNFVQNLEEDEIFVRTYERGVEDETYSCGTGVTASALMSAHNYRGFNQVKVNTKGGILSVEFNKTDDNQFENIWLCGPAAFVFKGDIELN